MARIVISYSTKSKSRVASLAEDLRLAQHDIWFDHELTGGQSWWDQIVEEIIACDVFIFALTPQALDSYPCRLEYGYAHQLGKPILPILMEDGVPIAQLPDELQAIQFVDYREQSAQAAFRLAGALANLPPPNPLPDPLPEAPTVPISYVGKLREQIDATALNLDEQASLVFKLKERLNEPESKQEAIGLLRRLRERPDLFARIDREIGDVLAQAERAPRLTKPGPAKQVAGSAAAQAQTRGGARLTAAAVIVFLVGSAFLVAVGFDQFRIESSTVPSVFPYRGDAAIAWLAIAYIVHGLFAGSVLRLLIVPRVRLTPARLGLSALLGGPLNGAILRVHGGHVTWWQIGIIALGWFASVVIGLLLVWMGRQFGGEIEYSGRLWGAATGLLGAVWLVYVWWRVGGAEF